ncbi:MAG TPA: S8 family serine peptidase, partial [Nocardioides sp.]|nr:S8 family serine peptidase [Nocardioides sp.]
GGRGLIGLDFARALSRGRRDVRVAVLDTGINLDHPELRGKIVAKADFVDLQGLDTSSFVGDFLGADDDPEDELGHGTHVAGIIAAEGVGMDPGIAPGCSLMAVRVLATLRSGGRDQGAGVVDNINPGIKFAADNDADVINMSLGIRHVGGGLPHEDVIRYALARGVTVVAASGNDGTDTKYYPGALPGVVAVGAVDGEGRVASFTSYGAQITVVAPGVNILSSFAHGRYAVASGTSQASPCVAGAVALLKSFARDNGVRLGPDDVLRILRETSDRPDRRLRSTHAGYGVLNMTDAFKWLMASLN